MRPSGSHSFATSTTIYHTLIRCEAIIRFGQRANNRQNVAPRAFKCIEDDLDEPLPFLDFPNLHTLLDTAGGQD